MRGVDTLLLHALIPEPGRGGPSLGARSKCVPCSFNGRESLPTMSGRSSFIYYVRVKVKKKVVVHITRVRRRSFVRADVLTRTEASRRVQRINYTKVSTPIAAAINAATREIRPCPCLSASLQCKDKNTYKAPPLMVPAFFGQPLCARRRAAAAAPSKLNCNRPRTERALMGVEAQRGRGARPGRFLQDSIPAMRRFRPDPRACDQRGGGVLSNWGRRLIILRTFLRKVPI